MKHHRANPELIERVQFLREMFCLNDPAPPRIRILKFFNFD
jgi:hypothetical protein